MTITILKNLLVLLISSGVLGWEVNMSLRTANAFNILDLMLITVSGVMMTLSLIRFIEMRKNTKSS